MKNEEKPNLFPQHFKIGKFSGSPRDFTKGKISFPRGGEDILEYWYTDDPEESEYLDEDFQENIDNKINKLKSEGWDPEKQIFYATTQSHLDLGWMWRFRQGVAKAERTMEKVHKHFKLFKPFTFTNSQPAQYQWVKYNSPHIWEMIKKDINSGRHELQGGSWSEADGRMPSGESWVRQRLYGQLFYANNFGKLANISWFPDSFGYADNLPQIFSKSGANGFMTSKLTSNKQTKWPFWAWIWEAPDGSRLTSYLSGNHNKLGPLGGYDVEQKDSEVRESYKKSFRLLKLGKELTITYEMDKPEEDKNVSDEELPFIGCFFGEGDGGHGPQGIEMAVYRAYNDRGFVEWKSTKEIFEEIEKYRDRLPVWKDELYYQFHRGSLTTQIPMKRMNRFFEWNLPVLEGLATLTNLLSGSLPNSFKNFYSNRDDQIKTTDNPIEQIWQNTLLMQFHDVLPGTSIPEVYDECYEMWNQDLKLLRRLIQDSTQELKNTLGLDKLSSIFCKIGSLDEEFIFIPILVANMSGTNVNRAIEFNANLINSKDLVPIAVISLDNPSLSQEENNSLGNLKLFPLNKLDEDKFCFDLDKKPSRYQFICSPQPWGYSIHYIVLVHKPKISSVNSIFSHLERQFNGVQLLRSEINLSNEIEYLKIEKDALIVKIDKATGKFCEFSFKGKSFLSNPAGLEAFVDKPYREDCWNLMQKWWEHPKSNLFSNPIIEIKVDFPALKIIRINYSIGDISNVYLDVIFNSELDGFGLDIGMDFHEIETLIKLIFPLNLKANYSVSETPYSTIRRRNEPVANHDVSRWEKWMHTFVCIEEEEGKDCENKKLEKEENSFDEKEKKYAGRGLAVINQGKYGFDTINNHIGISIVHGPEYPKANVVAWVRDERKNREKLGKGAVPQYADQGENLTRLWIIPYEGTCKDGKIHNMAHSFNRETPSLILDEIFSEKIEKNPFSHISIEKLKSFFNFQNKSYLFSTNPSIEISIIKEPEKLPNFMDTKTSSERKKFIFRLVNNLNETNSTTIFLDKCIVPTGSAVIETDLLERNLKDGRTIELKEDSIHNNKHYFVLEMKPHEIITYGVI